MFRNYFALAQSKDSYLFTISNGKCLFAVQKNKHLKLS